MKAKKVLIMISCAVLLIVGTVFATMAFFTDEESVTNTFTVGKITIDLDEAKVDEYGTPIAGADRVKENDYKLIPGHEYTKDPTMTVKNGSEPSYLRMMVTLTGYSELVAAFGLNFDLDSIVDIHENWICVAETQNTEEDTVTFEYRYHRIADGLNGDVVLEPLFTTLTMPEDITAEDLANIASSFDMIIVGHAMQADGIPTADAAWEAFDK